MYMLASSTPVPHWLTFKGVDMMESVVTLSCTNVKGPSKKMVFFGCEVDDVLFFSTLAPDRSPGELILLMKEDPRLNKDFIE
jgi:hypothetical protein